MVELPSFRVDAGQYDPPGTETIHKRLVQSAVDEHFDFAIINPTLRSEFLDYHALAALFQNMGELTPVFIISPNTAIRDRYEQLRDGMHYSEEKWPLSTVKSDGSLASRTTHSRSNDAPPGVIFTRYSTRLPNDQISEDIRLVLYDGSVKYEEERWERFQEWRSENDVPAVGYFIRDPLGAVFKNVSQHVAAIWNWMPESLDRTLALNEKNETMATHHLDETVNGSLPEIEREHQLLETKADGQTYEVHLNRDSPVVSAFSNVWEEYDELKEIANDIDEQQLHAAVGVTGRALSGFSRLLSNLRYSDNYRAEHGMAVPLSGRISQVKQMYENLQGDAAAGTTSVEHVHYALTELRDAIGEAGPDDWKRGGVLKAMQRVMDREERLIVVAPDEPAKNALQADLRLERERFYDRAREFVEIHTPRSLPQASPADYLLLYGPPKYSDRWLLRAPSAPYVGILSYPHELGLLHSQVTELNRTLRDLTLHNVCKEGQDEHGIMGSLDDKITSVYRNVTDAASSPTQSGDFPGIDIDIPEADEVEDGTYEDRTELEEYEFVSTDETSIDDIVSTTTSNYESRVQSAIRTSSSEPGHSTGGSERSQLVEGCVDIRVKGGMAYAAEPSDSIEVINPDSNTTIEKPVEAVQPGEKVVAIHAKGWIRDEVEELLLDSGHIKLVSDARRWKNRLQDEIEYHEDDLDDFIARIEAQGVEKRRSTYRSWYNGEIHLPKAKKSLRALARAYEMDEVLEHFDQVWEANHTIVRIKNQLLEYLKRRAQKAVSTDDDDLILDEDLDVRISDFELGGEEDDHLVEVHTISDVATGATVSRSQLRRWRSQSSE